MTSEMRWEAPVDTGRPGLRFLVDHRVDGTPVMPAAAFVEIALSASPGHDLPDLRITASLPVPAAPGRRLQTILDGDGTLRIVGFDTATGDAGTHASGRNGRAHV